ncbi:MAG TPA: protein-tyrosine phosphatase family protein [Rhizomicrobium sp.]|nr:protein-tyrosine phosphatase family protein [Rhizomicrobium sp.]
MTCILVSPLSAIERAIDAYQPSHLITLLSPEDMITTPAHIAAERHLKLALNDVVEEMPDMNPPTRDHILRLLEFGRDWRAQAPLLVHCWAGVSRSMAAAYTLLCERAGPGREFEIARALRRRAPHAYPNPLMIRLADTVLQRDGQMVAAVASIGRGEIVLEGSCVLLPLAI